MSVDGCCKFGNLWDCLWMSFDLVVLLQNLCFHKRHFAINIFRFKTSYEEFNSDVQFTRLLTLGFISSQHILGNFVIKNGFQTFDKRQT